MVDDACWEPRQPQDFLRAVQEYSNHLPWTRPDPTPIDLYPVANFSGTPTMGVVPMLTQFTDLTLNTPTSWLWDFGDGSTSTSQNPSHNYVTSGIYNVTLTATNATGSNSVTLPMYIAAQPVPEPPQIAQTWDPANLGAGNTLSNGNLTGTCNTFYKACMSTGYHNTGKKYFEVLAGAQPDAFGFIGISASTNDINDLLGGAGGPPWSHASQTRMISGSNGAWGSSDAFPATVPAGPWTAGDVLGFAVDFTTHTIKVYKNGVLTPTTGYFLDLVPQGYTYGIAVAHSNVGGHVFTIKTIQGNPLVGGFTYAAPAGYDPWGMA